MDKSPLGIHQVKLVVQPEMEEGDQSDGKRQLPISIYLAQASMMAVVLDRQHTALKICLIDLSFFFPPTNLCTFARSPPGTTVGG